MRNLACSVLVLIMVIATSVLVAGEAIKIDFWHWHYPNLAEVIAEFNEQYAGEIVVESTLVDYGEYYQKMQIGLAGGVGPDLAIAHGPNVSYLRNLGLVRSMTSELSKLGISRDSFAGPGQNIWGLTMLHGEQYALPLSFHSLLLYYNRDSLAQAGIAGPPSNQSEYEDYAAKLTVRGSGDSPVEQWGTQMWPWWMFSSSAIRQHGGSFLANDGREVVFDSQEAVAAMQFLYDLVFTKEVAPPPGVGVDFGYGDVAMQIHGVWMLGYYNQTGVNYGVSSADNLLGNKGKGIAGNAHVLVLCDNGGTQEERMAAMKLADYLTEKAAYWVDDIPVRIEAVLSEAFQDTPEYLAILEQEILFMPLYPWIDHVNSALEQSMNNMWYEQLSPYQALTNWARQAQVAIDNFIENMTN